MARKYTEYRRNCEVCGEVFYSTRIDARFDTNACKMKHYRRAKAAKLLEQKFQLDMETYALFQQVCDRTPALANMLATYLHTHDQDSFKQVLAMLTVAQTQGDTELYTAGGLHSKVG